MRVMSGTLKVGRDQLAIDMTALTPNDISRPDGMTNPPRRRRVFRGNATHSPPNPLVDARSERVRARLP
jgi:hypothetical protein